METTSLIGQYPCEEADSDLKSCRLQVLSYGWTCHGEPSLGATQLGSGQELSGWCTTRYHLCHFSASSNLMIAEHVIAVTGSPQAGSLA